MAWNIKRKMQIPQCDWPGSNEKVFLLIIFLFGLMPGLSPAWRFSTIKPATVRKLLYKSFPWSQLFFWSAKAGRDKANPYDTPPDRIRLQDGRPLDHTNARLPQVSDKTSSARRHIKVELCPLQSINHKPKNTARNFHFQWWASNWHDAISILKFIIFYTCQDICFAISVVQCCLEPPQASLKHLAASVWADAVG